MKPADLVPSFVSALAEHTLIARLFLASIEFTVVAALIWFVLRIGLVRAPRLISALWLLALSKAVVSLTVGSPWAVLTWQPSAVAKVAEAKGVADVSDVRAHGSEMKSETKLVATAAQDQPESPQGSSARAFPLVARGADDARRASRSVANVLVASWLAGLALSLTRSLVQRLRLRRIVLQSVAPKVAYWPRTTPQPTNSASNNARDCW